MTIPPSTRYYNIARDILDAIVAGWPVEEADLPDRRLVLPGTVSWDCDLLGVQVANSFPHDGSLNTAPQPGRTRPAHLMTGLSLVITLIRCVAVGKGSNPFPTATAEEDSAETILRDAVLLQAVLGEAEANGDIGGCSTLVFDGWTGIGPEGAYAGGQLRLRVSADRRNPGAS